MNREDLIRQGFEPRTYQGQEGEFLANSSKLEKMTYASQLLVDGDSMTAVMNAITEITPDGDIQLIVTNADYIEGPVKLSSEEGQALFKDALASKNEQRKAHTTGPQATAESFRAF